MEQTKKQAANHSGNRRKKLLNGSSSAASYHWPEPIVCFLTGSTRHWAIILVETTSGSLEPEDLQAGYFQAELRIPATVPKEVRERVHVARTLGAYAWFVHEFNAVSMFWSLSCIEMAVWVRFVELNPGPFKIKKGKQHDTVALTGIEDRIREKWRIEEMQDSTSVFER